MTTAARAPPPEKLRPSILTYLPPKIARKAAPSAPSVWAVVPSLTAGGEDTKKPAMMPRRIPATSSTGALSTSQVKFCWLSDSPERASARQTPKPAMASTSSKEAAAMTIDGTPLSVPYPRVCKSSMPGTTTAGETAAMTKPRRPAHAYGRPRRRCETSATVKASVRHGKQARRTVTHPIFLSFSRSRPSPARSMMTASALERRVKDHHSKEWPRRSVSAPSGAG
mmetsp:Transcript_37403/g.79696  ORF Transcript_37403/g.79696 Transcript_37403/m.79696 type:complete len:225 (+) Transcript_37403:1687-2361(+)